MVYKNLFTRFFISLFLISIYILILNYNFELINYLVFLLYLIITIEVIKNFKKFKLLILFYLLISFIAFINIDLVIENIYKFNFFIIIIVSFDIFSYVVGKRFGKKKIFKYLSPNKTLEGLIGGGIGSIICSSILLLIYEIEISFNIFLLILFFIFFSLLGDLFESFFKRKNNIKNSSNFLPGHGGFFDRFDSFISSIIFIALYSSL